MKTTFLSGLAIASLLLASCSAGEQEAVDAAPTIDPSVIDPAAAETGYLAQMQGSWKSDDDAGNIITIKDSRFQSFAGGALQEDVPVVFVDSCKTRVPDVEGKAFVLAGKEKQSCYLIYAVSEDKLSYVESTRGRTTRFTREK